jgi:hypothetical protein
MVPDCQVGGSEYTVTFEKTFTIFGDEIVHVSNLYFLADNAAAVYINGVKVGITSVAWIGEDDLSDAANPDSWANLHDFRLYVVDADDLLDALKLGVNEIVIIASNEPVTPVDWNPCGVMLAFEVYSKDLPKPYSDRMNQKRCITAPFSFFYSIL